MRPRYSTPRSEADISAKILQLDARLSEIEREQAALRSHPGIESSVRERVLHCEWMDLHVRKRALQWVLDPNRPW